MSFKDMLDRGVFFGFVPHQLEIKDRPEFDVFPFNVLFMKCKVENERNITGTALYEPDLESFEVKDGVCSMYYHNVWGGKSWLVITYDPANRSYVGEKFVEEKSVGIATGVEWSMFFAHFTALGLTNGERCKFENEVGA